MNDKQVTNWQERLSAEAKAVAVNERPMSSNISIRSGIMSINSVPVPGNKMQAVVIAYSFERVYYPGAFDPNNIQAPVCFALSLSGENMVPDPSGKEVQAADCASCPKNQWADNPKRPGRKHKECKEKRRIVLIPANSIKEGEIAKAEMATMSVPVTSIKNWANYVNLCATGYDRPPWAVATEISVHPHIQNQLEVKFEVAGQVQEAYLGEISNKIEQGQALAMTPYEQTAEPEKPVPEAEGGKKRKY